MPKYTAPPEVELVGFMAISFLANIQGDETAPILAKYGLGDIDPNTWYPAQKLMDVLSELSELNMSSNFIAIGMDIGKRTPFPDDIKTLEDVLESGWDMAYKSVHRNHDNNIGSVKWDKVTDRHYRTVHDHLYPDDFSYGIVYGFAKRFLPEGTDFRVHYDPDLPQRDEDGADVTVIHVSW